MFDNPLPLIVGAETFDLPKIDDGNYSSEFFLRGVDAEFRVKVRHSKERGAAGKPGLDRHNVELTKRTYPGVDTPERINTAYVVIRNDPNSDGSEAADLANALVAILTETAISDLIGWQS